jgi:hypothetical protein
LNVKFNHSFRRWEFLSTFFGAFFTLFVVKLSAFFVGVGEGCRVEDCFEWEIGLKAVEWWKAGFVGMSKADLVGWFCWRL